jgi:uncharacterized protein YuzE
VNDQTHNFDLSKRVHYFPDTDSFHVDLTDMPTFTGAENRPDVVTYYDENNVPCAILVEHATRHPRLVAKTLKLLREHVSCTADL